MGTGEKLPFEVSIGDLEIEPGGAMAKKRSLLPAERIERSILVLRGEKVILDADIAALYGVETRTLVQAMKRNLDRFPPDFMFQLTPDEVEGLRSQIVISNRGGRRYLPYAFSEQGVAMLSSVLRSERAVQINIEVMRVFVRLRRMMSTREDLIRRLDELEQRYDAQFKAVFDALRQLMAAAPRKQIGFKSS
jgi:ORF6N domain-containing protein